MKFLSVFIVIVSLSGCSQPPVAAPDHVRQFESAIILVPGYYGTRLVRETDGRLIFISLTQALFGDQSLTLPVPGLGFEGTVNLQPDGILDEIRVVPLFYSIDVYGSLLDRLRLSNKENQEVISFAYDWRGDLMEAVRSLDVLIMVSRSAPARVGRIGAIFGTSGGGAGFLDKAAAAGKRRTCEDQP
jgi:hypothetical protein